MKKIILASLAALSLVSPLQAQAQEASLLGIKGLSANVGAVSDYRFRGLSQTFGKTALQGGLDYVHDSGVYAGNWNSQDNEGAGFPSGHWETDFYAGFKKSFGDFGLDVGAIYYGYPGSNSTDSRYQLSNGSKNFSGTVSNTEVYVAGSWKWLSLKYFHSTGDYFSVPSSRGTNYLDLSASYELKAGWTAIAHFGRLNTKGINTDTFNANYNDYKLGVTKDINGWIFGAAAIWTTAQAGKCSADG